MPNIMGDTTPDEMYEQAVKDVVKILSRKEKSLEKDGGHFVLSKAEAKALRVCREAVQYDKEFA